MSRIGAGFTVAKKRDRQMKNVVYTSCTLDCPDGCGILAHVVNDRVVKLEGHPNHAFTRGFLCGKTYRFPQRMYSEERQLYPLKRVNENRESEWVRVSWDEALDTCADRIRKYISETGNLSLMHYQRTGSWGATKLLNRRFWNLLGGVTTTSGSLCSGAARAGQAMDFGARIGHDPIDLVNSRFVLLWGRNPMATNLHMVQDIKAAQARGARVFAIDPIHSESVRICDGHVQPRVAKDAELALAMAKVVIEEGLEDKDFIRDHTKGFSQFQALLNARNLGELCDACGLPESEIRTLARDYATSGPSAILIGWGLNKYKKSAEIFRCVDALAAICGYVSVEGGGVTHGYDTQRHFDKSLEGVQLARCKRAIPEPVLGNGLLQENDPPVRMMFVNGGNPVNQSPNSNAVARAFEKLEFTVVVDSFLTDTADYADIFLPTTTFLEEEDALVSWGHNIIGGVNPVVEPVGEARSDLWIYQRLAERLGIGEEMAGTPRDWLERILAPLAENGVSVNDIMEQPVRCPTAPQVPFSDHKFRTASGKFEFLTDYDFSIREVPGYPLTLLTNFSKSWLLSQMTSAEHPEPFVRIGPQVAEEYGVEDNETIVVKSTVGELEIIAQVDDRIGAGMVVMPVGTWIKRGGGANILTEDILTNHGLMAAYGETRVAIEKLADRSSPA